MNTQSPAQYSIAVSTYHIDLWEHAAELVRALQWQQAIEIFAFLAKEVEDVRERTKCLLNQALVEARLGDHKRAVLTVAAAAELGEDMPITAFLAGLINCEISQLAFAEAWFESCLTDLAGKDLDYDERFTFVLEHAAAQHNLDAVGQARLAQELGFEDSAPDDLVYIPAGCLFQAPPRPMVRSSAESAPTHPLQAEQCEVPRPMSVLSYVPSSGYSVAHLSQESSEPLLEGKEVSSPDRQSFERPRTSPPPPKSHQKQKHTPIVVRPSLVLKTPVQPSPIPAAKELRSLARIREREAGLHNVDSNGLPVARAKIPYTWHGQQKQRREPRDARAISDSTKELAHFMQEFAPAAAAAERTIKSSSADPTTSAIRDTLAPLNDSLLLAKRSISSSAGSRALDRSVETKDRVGDTQGSGLNRSISSLAKNASLLDVIRLPKASNEGVNAKQKPSKIRWPFQDGEGNSAAAGIMTAAGSAGLKPVQLDFIMGPNGKTIVIEKAPKAATSLTQAMQLVQHARRHDHGAEPEHSVSSLAASSSLVEEHTPRHPAPIEQPQPSAYEPPGWGKRNQSQGLDRAQISSPIQPQQSTSPLMLHRVQGARFLSPQAAEAPTRKPVPAAGQTGTPTPPQRSPVPSVVSSVNMWDYLLDKLRPDEGR